MSLVLTFVLLPIIVGSIMNIPNYTPRSVFDAQPPGFTPSLTTIQDSHVVYNLNNLANKGSYTVFGQDAVYEFDTQHKDDGWYYSSIITKRDGASHTVSFQFMLNDDGGYTLVSDEFGMNGIFVSDQYAIGRVNVPNSPDFLVKDLHASDSNPYELRRSEEQQCGFWKDSWSVSSSTSDYMGMVRVKWDGESSFRHYCLFPYDLFSVTINYEGDVRNNVSGWDNFDLGTAPYVLTGSWKYTSVS